MSFHVMAKPGGATCNMNCTYCFFRSKAETLGSAGAISDEMLDAFVGQYIEAQPPGPVIFTWQGGEPTLLGIDFFRRVLVLERKHCPPGKTIANDLQTNGLLLDDEWCAFLKENDFLVGLSIDGPKELHDSFRRGNDGHATFGRVVRAAELLRKHEVPFNTLTALHRRNAKRPREVYRFLRDEIGSTCMQFLPVVEPACHASTAPAFWNPRELPRAGTPAAQPGDPGSFVAEWSVEPDDFGHFLAEVFELWSAEDAERVIVPFFDCMIRLWLGMASTMCVFDERCGHALALDSDGSVYFCDRFCYTPYRLGSLAEARLADLVASERNWTFGKMKGAVSPKCRRCRWAFACRGECPKNRFLLDENGHPGLNYLCSGLQIFFEYLEPRMTQLRRELGKIGKTEPVFHK